MSIRRIGVLLGKEFKQGLKSYFFIFAVLGPLILTLVVNLAFGSLFSRKPRLGIVDFGESRIVESLTQMESIQIKTYTTESELKDAVETGARDMGVVFQKDFDAMLLKREVTKLTAYIWGESLLNNRALLGAALLHRLREQTEGKAPVDIVSVSLGENTRIPWKDRFLPMIVLMAIFISGFALPSTSLVVEKQKRTLGAVLTTPVSQGEVFLSKGLIAIIVSMVMGITILILNDAFKMQSSLLVCILFLGAIMASCFGLLLGAIMKDLASVFSSIKGFNIFLYAPAIVSLFPKIPEWVGKIFPTYYVMNPIMEITQKGGGWSTVRSDVFILIGLIVVIIVIVGIVAHKTRQPEA